MRKKLAKKYLKGLNFPRKMVQITFEWSFNNKMLGLSRLGYKTRKKYDKIEHIGLDFDWISIDDWRKAKNLTKWNANK